MNVFFVSDTHFGHRNIVKYSKRPFLTTDYEQQVFKLTHGPDNKTLSDVSIEDWEHWEKMRLSDQSMEFHDETLIANWNNTVTNKNDTVYCLGDFGFGKREEMEKVFDRLNGQIHFVRGNHDKSTDQFKHRFVSYRDMSSIKISDTDLESGRQHIVLCHYAMLTWNKIHYGTWQIFGHSHSTLNPLIDAVFPNHPMLDVGVDSTAKRLGKDILSPENYRPVSYEEVKELMSTKEFKPIDHHELKDKMISHEKEHANDGKR